MPCHSRCLTLVGLALLYGALPGLSGQSAPAPAETVAASHTDEQKAALISLDADIVRLDALVEKITEPQLKATTRGFIAVFKQTRGKLRQAFDQTKYDEVKFEVVAELQRMSLWLAPPQTRPINPDAAPGIVVDLDPSPTNPAEVKAALEAAEAEIRRQEERNHRSPASANRDAEALRLKTLKSDTDLLGRNFTKDGWDALVVKLKGATYTRRRR